MEDKNIDTISTEEIKNKKRRKKKASHSSSTKRTHSKKQPIKPKKRKFNKLFFALTLSGLVALGAGYYFLFHNSKHSEGVNSSSSVQTKPLSQDDKSKVINFDTLNSDQKDEIVAKKFNSNPLLQGWNDNEVKNLKNYVAQYAIDKKFVQKASLKDSGIFSLMNNKDMYSDVLTQKEFLSETTGYPYENTTGVFLNEQGFVKEVLPDSPAYVSGIRKNWQLFNIDNYNKPFFSNKYKINDTLLSKSNSVWRNPENQYFNFNPIQTYPAIGSVAIGIVQNHILNIQIKEITKATPGRVYSIIKDNIYKEKINGILIDLRTTKDTINGVQETGWILNGGSESIIAIATNNKNENFNIVTRKPSFEIDPKIINFIKNTKKIIVVDKNTKGISEALAYNLQQSRSSLVGSGTFGKNTIETTFISGNKGVKITTYTFNLPDNHKLPLSPSIKINLNVINQLYTMNQY